jgi:hypothetical protein
LKEKYWLIRTQVADEYNFGLVMLDCKKFKEITIKKMKQLLTDFEEHLLHEFKINLEHKWAYNENIWSDVARDWGTDIEASIKQMKTIELLHCDETYENLDISVKEMAVKKKFLDKLGIAITEIQYDKFLSLYAFPNQLLR